MKKIYYLLVLVIITPLSSSTMESSLSLIEQMILQQEIERRGADAILHDIRNVQPSKMQYDEVAELYFFYPTTYLEIETTVNSNDTDPLTTAIVEHITKTEGISGYSPTNTVKNHDRLIYATNTIGNQNSHYYWLEDTEQPHSTVHIQMKFQQRKPLTTFLKQYTKK